MRNRDLSSHSSLTTLEDFRRTSVSNFLFLGRSDGAGLLGLFKRLETSTLLMLELMPDLKLRPPEFRALKSAAERVAGPFT